MKGKKGLEAVRASLDSIFSTEGLKNIQRLREGTLSSLPLESFASTPETLDKIPLSDSPTIVPVTVPMTGTVTDNVGTVTGTMTGTVVVPTSNPTTVPTSLPFVGRAGLSPGQAKLLDFLLAQSSPCRMTYKEIANVLGLKQFSVRDNVYLFKKNGWLATTRWRIGTKNGTQISMRIERIPRDFLNTTTVPMTVPTTVPLVGTTDNALKIDRKIENLSIPHEVIQTTWPNLARCGFGVEQVNQIVSNLTAIGKSTSRIIQGLDHLEFELANGQMVDKSGKKVSDPCSWAFRALSQTGYYRRPKGYVSADEQAAKDAEEEARAVIAARQKAEQAQFEAWCGGLSANDLDDAMRGYPGGPKDAWLKTVWKKTNLVR